METVTALRASVRSSATTPLREVNAALHAPGLSGDFVIAHPDGAHNVAVGLDAPIRLRIEGHVGYYAAGMNQQADVTINGNAGTGVAENMMSGTVWVKGNASQSAGATAHGGLLVIEGKAAARCGISMKGVDIVVGGDVGHMSALHGTGGQAGRARRRRRGARGLDLRGAHLRPRRRRIAWRRLHRQRDASRSTTRSSNRSWRQPVSMTTPPPTPATDPPARSTTSTSTTRRPTDEPHRRRPCPAGPARICDVRPDPTIAAIQRAAETGIYDIRGWGAKRPLPHFDDLLFLGASMSRYPLEGYRERCDTDVVLGDRNAKAPLHLDIPVTIAGMSFGALSGPAKEALGRGASEVGTSTTTGDGGMTPRGTRAEQAPGLPIPSVALRHEPRRPPQGRRDRGRPRTGRQTRRRRHAARPEDLAHASQACAPCPRASTSVRRAGIPDWTGPDDLTIKINELREITDWEKPIYVKVGATRTYYDVKLAVHAGADVVVVDGMQGGTAATQEVFIEHVGVPTLAAVPQAVQALQELGVHRCGGADEGVQLIVSGGIRTGADVAKALALGADAVAIGTAALIALGDNHPRYAADYEKLGSAAGFFDDFQDGTDPAGISTQDPELASRFDPVEGGRRLANYLRVLTMEAQTIARACGKSHVRPPRARGPGRRHDRSCGDGPRPAGRDRMDSGPMSACAKSDAMNTADVVIVGGGIEGAAAAWALSQRGVTNVVVAERNTVGSGMTGKSSGIVRCHYGVSSLAAMATVGLEVFEKPQEIFGTDIGFRQTGYVVGVGEANVDSLRKSLAAQRAVGVQTEEIDAAEVARLWPHADLTPFEAFAWEARGGYGDAYRTAQAFAVSARAAGVRIRQGANVTGLLIDA